MLHCRCNCSLTQAMDGHIMCCSIISSYQSAATSEIIKALLGTCHRISSAIASTDLYLYTDIYIIIQSRLSIWLLSPLKRRDVRRRNFACRCAPCVCRTWAGSYVDRDHRWEENPPASCSSLISRGRGCHRACDPTAG